MTMIIGSIASRHSALLTFSISCLILQIILAALAPSGAGAGFVCTYKINALLNLFDCPMLKCRAMFRHC